MLTKLRRMSSFVPTASINSSKASKNKVKIVIRYAESVLDRMDWHLHNVLNRTAAIFTWEKRPMRNGSLPNREATSSSSLNNYSNADPWISIKNSKHKLSFLISWGTAPTSQRKSLSCRGEHLQLVWSICCFTGLSQRPPLASISPLFYAWAWVHQSLSIVSAYLNCKFPPIWV